MGVAGSLEGGHFRRLETNATVTRLVGGVQFARKRPIFEVVSSPTCVATVFPNRGRSNFRIVLQSGPFRKGGREKVASVTTLIRSPLPNVHSELHQAVREVTLRRSHGVRSIDVR